MSNITTIKPTNKAITDYYATLHSLSAQNVSHEMGLRRAFQELLAHTAKLHDWTLITEDSYRTQSSALSPQSSLIRPDATLKDKNTLPRGYWESKDPGDSLTKEITKKTAKGYSLVNTIFEDSKTAILYQNKKHAFTADLADPQALCDLLNQFYAHTEPDIQHFEEAVNDFKDRVPELAKGLVKIIADAHKKNLKFKKAFTDFFTLCQTALNPNIAESAVDEMLVQHILTERLFRTIFNAADFTQRNVIAAEVEKVIKALASQSFSREEYLKGLDRFYLAIENAAKHLDWTDKQHFLNIVYERFFQGYSTKTADTMGIVYTPQPIVDFMCSSVAEVLKKIFKKDLGDADVFILDPCTGTGNFIVNLLKRIPPKKLSNAYMKNLFANEIMLLPYYIAALNIEHANFVMTGTYEPFEGLCFVDTLDITESKQSGFDFFTQKNSERVQRQRKAPITVVIGNPPYNVGQGSENENNKNRKYEADKRISETYARDSTASSVSKLSDPYVKFFRWATDRLNGQDGIVCFVSNNSFVDQIAFDGMRLHLAKDFQRIYHLNLRGKVRDNPGLSGTAYNVFGIQLGVGITVAVRRRSLTPAPIYYHEVPLEWRREEKLRWISQTRSISSVEWRKLAPNLKNDWLAPASAEEFEKFTPIAGKKGKGSDPKKNTIFQEYTLGVTTSRDDWMYGFELASLQSRVRRFIENYNSEVDRWFRRTDNKITIDDFVTYDATKISWSRDLKKDIHRHKYAEFNDKKIRDSLYRPFVHRHLFYDSICNEETRLFTSIFPAGESNGNVSICATGVGAERPFAVFPTDRIPDLNFFGPGTVPQWYPFYICDEDGSNRRENITDWSLTQFRTHYKNKKISKWNIFHYVYGILHHPAYRSKFADNLKRELPRIPFAPDFDAFAKAGKKLADLHLNYESAKEFPLKEIITEGVPRSPRVESKMKLSKDKTSLIVNPSLVLAGIPEAAFNYRLGNRSALDWIIDQYQLYTDPRTQITSDPNAWGEEHNNPEYILQLIAKIITVSLDTQKIITALPDQFAEPTKP